MSFYADINSFLVTAILIVQFVPLARESTLAYDCHELPDLAVRNLLRRIFPSWLLDALTLCRQSDSVTVRD